MHSIDCMNGPNSSFLPSRGGHSALCCYSGLDDMTCTGQWNLIKHGTTRGLKRSCALGLALLLVRHKHENMPRLPCWRNVTNTWRRAKLSLHWPFYTNQLPQSLQLTIYRCMREPSWDLELYPDQQKCLGSHRLVRQKLVVSVLLPKQ